MKFSYHIVYLILICKEKGNLKKNLDVQIIEASKKGRIQESLHLESKF
jgi:hypothetical protein